MDIALLKTFLEVARNRHFGRAAERLHITQSAVSARIKLLEETLGGALFLRKRNDLQLTAAGIRLKRHAQAIVEEWDRARQELLLEPAVERVLALGFQLDLWSILGAARAARRLADRPGLALRVESLSQAALTEQVTAGILDLAFLFDPPLTRELAVRQLGQMPLLLVSSFPAATLEAALGEGYIYVDWGSAFAHSHARLCGERAAPRLRAGFGVLAMDILLERGGSAFIAAPMAEAALAAGRLYRVADAPVIQRQVFCAYRAGRTDEEAVVEAARLFELPAAPALSAAPRRRRRPARQGAPPSRRAPAPG